MKKIQLPTNAGNAAVLQVQVGQICGISRVRGVTNVGERFLYPDTNSRNRYSKSDQAELQVQV